MRKFTLFLGAALAAASISAAPAVKTVSSAEALKTVSNRHLQAKSADALQRVRMTEDARKSAEGLRRAKKAAKAAATVAGPSADDKIISEAQGTVNLLSKKGVYIMNSIFGVMQAASDGNVLESVKSEDGKKLYLKYAISAITDNYIAGDIEGDKVTFNFPQYILHDEIDLGEGEVYTFDEYAVLCEYDEEEQWYFPSANQTYVMNIAEDGSLSVPTELQEVLIGDCMWIDGESLEEGQDPYWEWQVNGDTYVSASVVNEKPAVAPDGMTFEDWTFVNGITGSPVQVGFADNGDIYMKGLYENIPDAVVVAVAGADGKYTLANNQYLGVDEMYASFTYFQTASIVDDGFNISADLVENGSLTYDKETSHIQFDCDIAFSSITDRVYAYSYALKPLLVKVNAGAVVSKLFTPELFDVIDFTDVDDPGYVGFTLSNMDADYNMLDLEKAYYQVIVNDEVFEFMPDEYTSLKEPMTDVPYLFNDLDNYDFEGYEDGEHWFQFYFMNDAVDSFGVRAGYPGADNKPVYSEVMWVVEPSSVEGISDSAVKSVRYYDLQGRAIASPEKGICIKSVTKADGSVKVVKIVR